MRHSAKQIAENASFQAFLNSYIREVNGAHWIKKEKWYREQRPSVILMGNDIVELNLPHQKLKFVIEVEYKSLVGRHTFGLALKNDEQQQDWVEVERLFVMISLIQELHLMAKENGCPELASHYDELLLRLIESYHSMTTYIEKRQDEAKRLYAVDCTFIESEQSLLFGHWMHPTPKSRQGMASWQHDRYAPELCGSFQLHYFRIDSTYIKEASILKEKATEIIKEMVKESASNLETKSGTLIPMHPLQAEWLLQQEYIQQAMDQGIIENLGLHGRTYTATSSVRAVYNPLEKWMLKFSIPVKVTNSLRVNKLHELKAGVVMAELLQKIDFLEEYPQFRVVDDPAFMTVQLPNRVETGFELIIRSNPFQAGDDKGIISIAALVQDALPGYDSMLKNIIRKLSFETGRPIKEVSVTWFKHYWNCAVEPMIRLYDKHGMALEAHQQNSLVDISLGYPTAYYFRDNQGYYLASSYYSHLEGFGVDLSQASELFYEEDMISNRFSYYLFINHIFSVIHRFGVDELIEEEELINWMIPTLRKLAEELTGAGKQFVQSVLEQGQLACKGNLLTRFHDVDELMAELEQAVYTFIPNPIHQVYQKERREREYASAFPL
ncbi:IucA/IucC family protein [Sutcliffiella halmapala]|uniref:IucA/IucC family protein n=1 Tax=Sutcliffiella halmapala TaxID=79882 RepID=UPI000995B720|nr:IucA/IucC family protein [Sutcliffiella halmapala]